VKSFVTVGTTAFDELIEAVDTGPFAKDALLQIAEGDYTPSTSQWIRFDDDIQQRISDADVVICHCGAGSVFPLASIEPLLRGCHDTRRGKRCTNELPRAERGLRAF